MEGGYEGDRFNGKVRLNGWLEDGSGEQRDDCGGW